VSTRCCLRHPLIRRAFEGRDSLLPRGNGRWVNGPGRGWGADRFRVEGAQPGREGLRKEELKGTGRTVESHKMEGRDKRSHEGHMEGHSRGTRAGQQAQPGGIGKAHGDASGDHRRR
jgi:hypothetical protein